MVSLELYTVRCMQAQTEEKHLLRPAEVADQLGATKQTIWGWCRSGKLPHIRLSSRNFRIRQSDLNAFLDARTR